MEEIDLDDDFWFDCFPFACLVHSFVIAKINQQEEEEVRFLILYKFWQTKRKNTVVFLNLQNNNCYGLESYFVLLTDTYFSDSTSPLTGCFHSKNKNFSDHSQIFLQYFFLLKI